MPKIRLPLALIVKLLPALTSALGSLIEAASVDSDGGKKVTKAEAKAITDELVERLRPVVLSEVISHFEVEDA